MSYPLWVLSKLQHSLFSVVLDGEFADTKFRQRKHLFFLPICGITGWVMKMDELKKRKTTRLKGADYNRNQDVFLTICTKERCCVLSRIVGTGVNIWQYRSNDHIIRNRQDYDEHLRYIYENPMRWYYDELYAEE